MVFGANQAISSSPGKARMSVRRLRLFATHKRNCLVRVLYGSLLIIISILLMVLDPLARITEYSLTMKEGRIAYEAFREPHYKIYLDAYVFNYTNLPQYINGSQPKIKVHEIGPFSFRELRTDENMRVDHERGTLTMNPKLRLEFVRERSVAHYKDVNITVPNIVLISFTTYLADNMGYFTNVGAYYSMRSLGSKLVMEMTADELMFGYKEPLVTLANQILPNWIDFSKTGIVDRFYADKHSEVELDLKNASRKYAINLWDGRPGLEQQGYSETSSNNCNRVRDTYEGMMMTPNMATNQTLKIFRSYGCRVFPFDFTEEVDFWGMRAYRYDMQKTAFNKISDYACPCTKNCLPDGFIDISGCYYGFPIALSKPHFQDVDPAQKAKFEGMTPDLTKSLADFYFEPTIGVPLKAMMRFQINAAVRTAPGNPIANALKDTVLPYIRIELYCDEPPMYIYIQMYLVLVVGPPVLIMVIMTLLISGIYLGFRGFYDYFRTDNHLVLTNVEPSTKRRSAVSLDSVENQNGEEMKEIALLLHIIENSSTRDP
ncbi:lysosome membrane protein 2-like [Aricia agestis]|uniref:lysosome membrane protein 2-like n=1 Tax=Aricia agestis TaxID=91739 RepID=UPI001C209EBD|nr:lysosome membrane protein 2-like [Aricia agestis]